MTAFLAKWLQPCAFFVTDVNKEALRVASTTFSVNEAHFHPVNFQKLLAGERGVGWGRPVFAPLATLQGLF